MIVKFSPNDKGNPPGKLAEAEVHFAEGESQRNEAHRIRHLGAAQRRGPERDLSRRGNTRVNGERRSFALLRPVADAASQERFRDLILAAYAEYEQQVSMADGD